MLDFSKSSLATALDADTKLVKETARLIDLHRAYFDELRTNPVQAEYRLLLLTFCRDSSHSRLIDYGPDRSCIAGVGFVGLNNSSDEVGMN